MSSKIIATSAVKGFTTANSSDCTDSRATSAALLSAGIRIIRWNSPMLQPDTWRLQLLLENRCKLVLPYQVMQHAIDETDP